jgi:phage/plasmid-like protein (TIGR03299 family)
MAHDLATINGVISMAYQGETPWHKLGTHMTNGNAQGRVDVVFAMQAANLNWNVELQPVFLADQRKVPNIQAVVRDCDQAILSTVGARFVPIQNSDAMGVLQPACEKYGVEIETAGALGNGSRTWMLAKLPPEFDPSPSTADVVRGFFAIVNAHDGSHSYQALPTPVRIVCRNTLNAAVPDLHSTVGRVLNIRHTAIADERIREAGRIVDRMIETMKQTKQTFADLAEKRMTPDEVGAWILGVLPDPEPNKPEMTPDVIKQRRRDVGALVWAGQGAALAGADNTGATAWACYNAVAEYCDHVRPGQAKSDSAIIKANESAIFGAGFDLKNVAMQRAKELVYVRR